MAISSPGIGSNLDVNSIVTQLMTVERRPLTLLDQKEASYQSQVSAYGTLKGSLASFQASMRSLSTAAGFQTQSALPADASVFTASAAAAATPGNYSVDVGVTAQSQVLAANGLASGQNPSSTGTLQIKVGSGNTATITIDASNNTLEGVRDAINAAHAGVTATVINAGGATPYKLVLSADATGAANTIQVTNNLAAGELHDAVASLAEVRPARDATLTVNGVAVTSASNTNSSVIPGVTLNLLKSGSTTLTVSHDSSSILSAVSTFVQAYNDLNKTISTLTAYDASTRQGGPLLGDSAARTLQSQVRAMLGQALTGTGSSFTTLSQVGVSFQKDGTLAVNSARLASVISSNFADIPAIFAVQGRSSNSLLTLVTSNASTQPGSYGVIISAAATHGAATATSAPAVTTTIDGTNDGFSVLVDGVASGALTLAHGSYTATELAAAAQTALSGASAFTQAGIVPTVTLSGGKLAITSSNYGTASAVSSAAGTALSALGFDGSEDGTGTDVSGTFSVNGSVIAATGSGQLLSGAAGSAAAGMKVQYSGTALQAAATPAMTLDFSRGFAARLAQFATDALGNGGLLNGRTAGIAKSIAGIDRSRIDMNSRLADVEARYRAQFTALDVLLGNLTHTQTFLTQQFAVLTQPSK